MLSYQHVEGKASTMGLSVTTEMIDPQQGCHGKRYGSGCGITEGNSLLFNLLFSSIVILL